MYSPLTEKDLVLSLHEGSIQAFNSLFSKYSNKLYRFALKYLKNPDEAEELVQEVFIKVWQNRHRLDSDRKFKSYLFTIGLNHVRKYYRKKAIALKYMQCIQQEESFIERHDINHPEDFEVIFKHVMDIIDEMPSRKREIFIQRKIEGKSAKEIAVQLGISPGTIDNHVSESLRFIKQRLASKGTGYLLFLALFF